MVPTPQRKLSAVLPALAVVLSLATLYTALYWPLNLPQVLISVVGLGAGIAFLLRKERWFFVLMQVWIFGQFPEISREVEVAQADGTSYVEKQAILDAGQTFKWSVGMGLTTQSGRKLELYLNLVPFLYLVLFRVLQSGALVGRAVTIKPLKKDSKLGAGAPLHGRATRVVMLGTEKHWILVDLDHPFPHAGRTIAHVLVRDKEGAPYKPAKAPRISYVVEVPEPALVLEQGNRKDQFQFLDWGLVTFAW